MSEVLFLALGLLGLVILVVDLTMRVRKIEKEMGK